ncbi:MAG: GldG family protein [Planctomycetota bacterium]
MSDVRKPFLSYLFQKVILRTLLLFGILYFLGLLVNDSHLRWDLTEDKRFTISEASYGLARELPDRLTIRAYFSKSDKLPESVFPYYQQAIDILREYEAASNGKIVIERFDPTENSAVKSEAEGYGIRAATVTALEATSVQRLNVWGSIVMLYRDRQSEVIDIALRYGEGYEGLSGLEYEISSRIWQLSNDKPTLGITGNLTSTPPNANPMNPMQARPRPMFQGLRRTLGDAFDIEDVDLNQTEPDPARIPCLLVVRPKEFNDTQVYRLDQYMMKGGRVIMFLTQGELSAGGMGQRGGFIPWKTGLEPWLEFQGVRVPTEFVVHWDEAYPEERRTTFQGIPVSQQVPNPFVPIISGEREGLLNRENPAIQPLRTLLFLWPHPVDVLDARLGENVTAEVLVKSHKPQSWRWKDLARITLDEMRSAVESGKDAPTETFSSPLIVALEGEFDSYYAKNPVPPSIAAAGTDAPGEEGAENKDEAKAPEVLKKSPTNQLVVIGNALFVSDMVLGGQRRNKQAEQIAQVAFNLVDWLARSPELIALRAKKYSDRAITDKVVEETEEMEELYREGDISVDEFKDRYNAARDKQKLDRKAARSRNLWMPILLVSFVGLVVWVLRTVLRAARPDIPVAVPPERGGDA